MGLERRGNNLYMYTKERRGDRVVSVYSGKGEFAYLLNLLKQERKEEAMLERLTFQNEKQKHEALDPLIDYFSKEAKAAEEALFLLNGYHEHTRQWRKKRT